MKAMILAAGEGRRMQPLTLTTPKPLLKVGPLSLLEHQLQRIKKAGISEVLINVSYLAQQIIDHLGDGSRYELNITYSVEPSPLETGGAINFALSYLLGSHADEQVLKTQQSPPFLLVNGDVWSDFNFSALVDRSLADTEDACLVLVKNPEHNNGGDFCFSQGDKVEASLGKSLLLPVTQKNTEPGYTFSGISLQRASAIQNYQHRRKVFPLKEFFDDAILRKALTGMVHEGDWVDVGTPERLNTIREAYKRKYAL